MKASATVWWSTVVVVATVSAVFLLLEADRNSPSEFWSVAFPGILTGIGTLLLAFVTVVLAYQDRRRNDQAQREERERNDQLLAETSQREAAQQHRAQAEVISAWTSGRLRSEVSGTITEGGLAVELSNPSAQPIYDVLIFEVFVQGSGPGTGEDWMADHLASNHFRAFKALPSVPPGTWAVELEWVSPPPQGVIGIEIAFTDRSGATWIRRATGQLVELTTAPPEHYGLSRPFPYAGLLPPYRDPRPA